MLADAERFSPSKQTNGFGNGLQKEEYFAY